MTKKQKTALLMELLPLAPVLLGLVAPLIEYKVRSMLTPPAPPPPGRAKWFVLAGVVLYAVFIAVTVAFVKLAWRWVL